ncbi:hypothetical protein [Edaphobacter albus]|uniref:hypothetical protein n=1 Tax=Edaphobacter sp. 4G125 TaxID=2763071 RepID=UPI0016460552|nr:hypothetical protein [Edaphobacter sp. 4G125]QNI37536.1 hypothetical protein H7846_04325 [Edaphobacter sp. 4G125]
MFVFALKLILVFVIALAAGVAAKKAITRLDAKYGSGVIDSVEDAAAKAARSAENAVVEAAEKITGH